MAIIFRVALTKSNGRVFRWLRRFFQARKHRAEQEREFYRTLGTYCRANNLSPICEDDWKTAAYIGNDDRINAKGDVLWTRKANLHR